MADVTARLAPVCLDFTDEAFAALVLDVVDATLRFEGSATPVTGDRPVLRRPPLMAPGVDAATEAAPER